MSITLQRPSLAPLQKEVLSLGLLVSQVDAFRIEANRKLEESRRGEMGQFLTPSSVARMMASMFAMRPASLRVLDAGAGVGSLSAALVAEACQWESRPREIHLLAYEVEPVLVDYLLRTFDLCGAACDAAGIRFLGEVRKEDFIKAGVTVVQAGGLFGGERAGLNAAILNPPYRKINSDSETRRRLADAGIETTNLYTAFLWLAEKMLDEEGEMVAITPRSYCNGPYFRPFRRAIARTMRFRRIHVFESRTSSFSDDSVLQENIIAHAIKSPDRATVAITASAGPEDEDCTVRDIEYEQLIDPTDEGAFIHIVTDELQDDVGGRMRGLSATLADLGLTVSTGRVVDFRATAMLRAEPDTDTVPLIYPTHFSEGSIRWPKPNSKKPNALLRTGATQDLLVPAGHYVLVKRFSAKEERRRIVAAMIDSASVPAADFAFENHLNYFHIDGAGLPPGLARGLSAFLNSSLVDAYFRQFNGHTQVNATDLRSFRYPTAEQLTALGHRVEHITLDQDQLDGLVSEEIFLMPADTSPTRGRRMIQEALAILAALGVPREQQNQRSALTLLSLLDMKPRMTWAAAAAPLSGITEMMDYFRAHFGVRYQPNSRETVRRFTIHQFVQIGLVIANPDNAARAVNSPDNRYQIETAALKLIQTYGTADWERNLAAYLASAEAMHRLHPQERPMSQIPVLLPDGRSMTLTAGGQNVLVKDILEKFCPHYTPGGTVLYIGDAGDKFKVLERDCFKSLGVTVNKHGKMPDVVVHDVRRNWLVLIEAVTSNGPVNMKRHNELKALFKDSTAGLVFVTAFEARKAMGKYLGEIAWETEVWVAEAPTHFIHFNGERYLGPYEGKVTA